MIDFDNPIALLLLCLLGCIFYCIKRASDKFYQKLEDDMRREHEERMNKALPQILEDFSKLSKKENQVSRDFKRVIVCAACKYGDVIICGARHYDSVMHGQLKAFSEESELRMMKRGEVVEGFIDNCGQFLDREEALVVATEAGQIKFKHDPKDELFSEDLY